MLGINFPKLSNFPPKRPLVAGLQCGRRAATSSRLVEVRTHFLLFVNLFTSCSVGDFVHSIDVKHHDLCRDGQLLGGEAGGHGGRGGHGGKPWVQTQWDLDRRVHSLTLKE